VRGARCRADTASGIGRIMVDLRHGIVVVESSLPEDMTLPERRRARLAETYAQGPTHGRRFTPAGIPDSRVPGFSEGGRDTQPGTQNPLREGS
jgi:hypothetical protein